MVLMKAMRKHKARIEARKSGMQTSASGFLRNTLIPSGKLILKSETAALNVGFQQSQDDAATNLLKTMNNMPQIKETDNEDQDFDLLRKQKNSTKHQVFDTEDGLLHNSPSVDQVREDCVPGNKQGGEVFSIKKEERKEGSNMDLNFADARAVGILNNVAKAENNATARPKKKKRNIVSTASNPQHSLS